MSRERSPGPRRSLIRGASARVARLLLALAVLFLTTGFLGASVSGTWNGQGTETVCGEQVSQPIAITFTLSQTAAAIDPTSPGGRLGIFQGNLTGTLDEVGGYRTPSEHGNFLGALDKSGALNGQVYRARKAGESNFGLNPLTVELFSVKMIATGGFFSYDKISGTMTRPWSCRVAPGSYQTKPGKDVISVDLTRKK